MGRRKLRSAVVLGVSFATYFSGRLAPWVFPSLDGSMVAWIHLVTLPFLALGALGYLLVGIARSVIAFLGRSTSDSRGPAYIVGSLVALAGLAGVLLVQRIVYLGLPPGSDMQRFDSAIWLEPTVASPRTERITPRQKMLADVVAHVLPGAKGSDLTRILGPSLESPYFGTTGRDMICFLGPSRGFLSIDSEWLLIWLDQAGRVKRFSVTED